MVTKNQIKLVVGLKQKKSRMEHGLFVAEGEKLVGELLDAGLRPYLILVDGGPRSRDLGEVEVVGADRFNQISSLKRPNGVLGVFHIPVPGPVREADWTLALDAVRDPGNLGTIIRLCDWFGIRQLLCSKDTVDCYNPKVLQATMGSIARVAIAYVDLSEHLRAGTLPVYGAFMDGSDVFRTRLPERGILLLGNEAHGISAELQACITHRIGIPQYGGTTAESLNVATASAILLSEIRR